MIHTYRTIASFYDKMKYLSLESTFNIDMVRPVRRTSLYMVFGNILYQNDLRFFNSIQL
jgi:hypothetical protein